MVSQVVIFSARVNTHVCVGSCDNEPSELFFFLANHRFFVSSSPHITTSPLYHQPFVLMAPLVASHEPIDPSAIYSGSLLSLIILILDLIAVVQVLNSDRSVLSKLLWCLLIFFFPIFGILIYL